MEGNRVYRFNRDTGALESVDISVGISNWNFTEVLDGLSEGQEIVLSLDEPGLDEGVVVVPQDD
jgi:HlyD family secretion protein